MLLTACVLTLIEREGIQKTMMPALSHSKQKGKEKSWKGSERKRIRAHPHTHEYKTCQARNIKDRVGPTCISCIGQYYFTCSGAVSAKHRPIMFTFMQIALRSFFFLKKFALLLYDTHKGA
jgi:hypothetical protein